MQVMANDAIAPVEQSIGLYENAGEPKKLIIIPNANHYDVYKFINPEIFVKTMVETIDWYQQYL